jgi:hypothetical protein
VRRSLLVALAVTGALAVAPAARADDQERGMQRITVDRVEVEPSPLPGLVRVRLFVSAIDLATVGSVLAITGPDAWEIKNAQLRKIPYLAGQWGSAQTEAAIVIVVQTSGEYGEDLDALKAAIKEELIVPLSASGLPRIQAAVIGYGQEYSTGKLDAIGDAADQLDKLTSDGEPAEAPVLLDALDRAIKILRKAKPAAETGKPGDLRKMIVVVSDGRDAEIDEDRDNATHLARRADKAGIRIHAIAYSPTDTRFPLFNLGELSKVSQGTFRWIQKKVDDTSLRTPFKKLREEITGQYVLTLLVPEGEAPRGKVTVETTLVDKRLASLPAPVPAPACGAAECRAGQYCVNARCVSRRGKEGRGIFGWLLILGGVVVGGFAVLVGIGFTITKLRERREAAAIAAPAAAPATAAAAAAAAAPAAAAAAVPVGPQLYVLTGPQQGQRVALRHGFTIGKNPGSDLSLAHDGFASGNHAQILMDAGGNCSIVDQGSTNGTYINGVRITSERLFDGMSIRCGSTELRFLSR